MSETIYLNGRLCNVYYVDSGATGANDGSSAADALTELPDLSTSSSNSVYLIRSNTDYTLNCDGTISNDNIAVMTYPASGSDFSVLTDELSGQGSWDSDTFIRADLTFNGDRYDVFDSDGDYFIFDSVNLYQPNSGTAATNVRVRFNFSGDGVRLTNCTYKNPSVDYSNFGVGPSKSMGIIQIAGDHFHIENFEYEQSAAFISGEILSIASQHGIYLTAGARQGILNNISFKSSGYYGVSDAGWMLFLSSARRDNLQITNISHTSYWRKTNSGVTGYLSLSATLYVTGATADGRVENINYVFGGIAPNSNDTVTPTAYENSLYGVYLAFTYFTGTIKNINVDAEQWDKAQVSTMSGIYIRNYTSATAQPIPAATIDTISAKIKETNTPSYAINFGIMPSNTLVKNVTGWNRSGTGYNVDTSSFGPSVENANIKGKIVVGKVPRFHASNWEMTVESSTGFSIGTGTSSTPATESLNNVSVAVVDSATVPVDQTANLCTVQGKSILAIESLNITPTYTVQAEGTLLVNNEDGISGNWRNVNRFFELTTTNVARTGGATYSIRGDPTTLNDEMVTWIAPRPFPGIPRTSAQVGSVGVRTLTLYAAYKNFTNPPDPDRIIVSLKLPDGETGTNTKEIYSNTLGFGWEPDNSTWTNDTGLTSIKLVFPFKYDRLEDIEVRIGAYWKEVGAYFYIDPQFVIT